MKIAVVDHKMVRDEKHFERLRAQGLEVDVVSNLDDLASLPQPAGSYDGYLFHPGLSSQRRCVDYARKECVGKKWAFWVHDVGNRVYENCAVFNLDSVDAVANYFLGNEKEPAR